MEIFFQKNSQTLSTCWRLTMTDKRSTYGQKSWFTETATMQKSPWKIFFLEDSQPLSTCWGLERVFSTERIWLHAASCWVNKHSIILSFFGLYACLSYSSADPSMRTPHKSAVLLSFFGLGGGAEKGVIVKKLRYILLKHSYLYYLIVCASALQVHARFLLFSSFSL